MGDDTHMTKLLIGMAIMVIFLVVGMIFAKRFKAGSSTKISSEWYDIDTLKAAHPEIAAQIDAAKAEKDKKNNNKDKESK